MFKQELKEWKAESHITSPIMYRYNYNEKILTIYTNLPGWLIGRGGWLYKKYDEIIKERAGYSVKIEFVETDYDVI